MKRIFRLQLFVCPSDNRKSKTCPFDKLRGGSESYRRIENLKWLDDPAECAGESGPGHQVTVVSDQQSVVSEKLEKNE